MSHPHDGSSIDLERELVRYLAERRLSRRYFLDRVAKLGAAAALAPVIAACTGGSATPAPASAAAPTGTPAGSASSSASPRWSARFPAACSCCSIPRSAKRSRMRRRK